MERWLQGISTNNPSDGDQASMGFCFGAPATATGGSGGREHGRVSVVLVSRIGREQSQIKIQPKSCSPSSNLAPAEIFVTATGSPPPLPPPMTPCFHRRPLDLRATHGYGDANTPLGSDNSFDAAAPTTRR